MGTANWGMGIMLWDILMNVFFSQASSPIIICCILQHITRERYCSRMWPIWEAFIPKIGYQKPLPNHHIQACIRELAEMDKDSCKCLVSGRCYYLKWSCVSSIGSLYVGSSLRRFMRGIPNKINGAVKGCTRLGISCINVRPMF